MQTPGTYISATGHILLIGWLFFGWGFDADPLEFDAMDVSVISGEAFEEMLAARTPVPGDASPTAPMLPEIVDTPPPLPPVASPVAPALPPETVDQPDVELPPPAAPAPLVTEAEPTPPEAPDTPDAPPPSPNVDINAPPAPTQADRVASTPTAPPPPDAQVDDIVREEVVPDATTTAEVVTEETTPTAPEETATEIAIENVKPSGLVDTSLRPVSRPSRPTPPAPEPATPTQTAETPAAPEPPSDDAVEAALAAALAVETPAAPATAAAPAVAAGPPMTGAERDSFRLSVNRCWNVDPGSVASRVTVEVAFELDRNGQVIGQPRLVSSDGDQSAVNIAFEAARRAILRCQSGGYPLPADKYEQWKDVVFTFDPSGMRLR
ncbi:Cell division and transport-associated protein TolA [Yoonia tamlensis]|uniref:Cell division and transport-associated protein TolA n=1 Tax=Yoonia tamlensis TaxID=390270 RepID=A0A1I6FRB9_9RHOB|nr:cell envelope integrity protein TolA [Yoonia tamlensis]SFR32495.1 Cell division and transport-associated protein TolA [Yoonia tamlensis]